MKFTTLIAAAALAVASTAATAENVTTATGEVVMIEKQGGLFALGGLGGANLAVLAFLGAAVIGTAASSSGTN